LGIRLYRAAEKLDPSSTPHRFWMEGERVNVEREVPQGFWIKGKRVNVEREVPQGFWIKGKGVNA